MPKQVLPNEKAFQYMNAKLKGWGFRNFTAFEVWSDLKRQNLVSPRPYPGREEGFTLSANGYEVVVWTTWIVKERQARKKDSGWVAIRKEDTKKALYFAKRHRTKNFIKSLLNDAWLAKTRVLNMPLCPVTRCSQRMEIGRGKALKSRFLICRNRESHPNGKALSLSWDYTLADKPRAKRHLRQKRKRKAKYRAGRRAKNKPTDISMLRRIPWSQPTGTSSN